MVKQQVYRPKDNNIPVLAPVLKMYESFKNPLLVCNFYNNLSRIWIQGETF